MALDYEKMGDAHPAIGGAAGSGTRAGDLVERPPKMPTRDECDYVVSDVGSFEYAISQDGAKVYVEEDINITDRARNIDGIEAGSGVEIVAGNCDPEIDGRGPEIIMEANGHIGIVSRYGEAIKLWGISMRGPRMDYHDPDHTADDFEDKQSGGIWCYDDEGTFSVVGCEFRGFTQYGVACGAKNYETRTDVRRSSFHHCQMEHYGYGIQHYNGFLSVRDSYFDAVRHAIASFGYETGGYAVATSLVGPSDLSGHAFDVHRQDQNLDNGSDRAGKFARLYQTTCMTTTDVDGYGQEFFALRGVSDLTSYVDKCHTYHDKEPEEPGEQGDAWRQETVDEWTKFDPRDNHFGEEEKEGYGVPKVPDSMEFEIAPDRILTVHGDGPVADYKIRIDGDARKVGTADAREKVSDKGDHTLIEGTIVGATDQFALSEDATIQGIITNGPMKEIDDDGTPLNLTVQLSKWLWNGQSQ